MKGTSGLLEVGYIISGRNKL